MSVQAAPKTHPGGVQGALFRFSYHSDETPLPVNKPPTANAAKLSRKKVRVGSVFFMLEILNCIVARIVLIDA
jgi:hypothetical protein